MCGLAAATAEMSSSCAEGRFRLRRSVASDSVSSDTTTTAVDADLAAVTAAAMPGARSDGVAQVSALDGPWPETDNVCGPAVRFTATEYTFTGGVLGFASSCWPSTDRMVGV